MTSPLVSVIIPFYNRYDWVNEAIHSVLNQTMKDFEILLVDDGSTDYCSLGWDKLDSRIKYVRLEKQRGPSAARNVGINLSCAEYISFLDSDDLFLDNKLETQIMIMEKHGVAFSHTSYCRISADRIILEQVNSGTFSGYVYPKIYLGCPIATPTVIIKKGILQGNRFNEQIHLAEDILFWIELSKHTKCLGINKPLTLVRMHNNNTTSNPKKQVQGIINIIQFGLLVDENLNWYLKQSMKSSLLLMISVLLFSTHDPLPATKYGLLAMLNNPVNVVVQFVRHLINYKNLKY